MIRATSTRLLLTCIFVTLAIPPSNAAADPQVIATRTTAGMQDGELRFHYLFVPNPGVGASTGSPRTTSAAAIVRGHREFKLILDFGDGSWLDYLAQSDRGQCTSHEEIHLRNTAATTLELIFDSALPGCARSGASTNVIAGPTSAGGLLTKIRVGSRTFTVDSEELKSRGAPAVIAEIGPEFAEIVNGPIKSFGQVSPFVKILFARLAPLYSISDDGGSAAKPYFVMKLPESCAFDARHDEPCTSRAPATSARSPSP